MERRRQISMNTSDHRGLGRLWVAILGALLILVAIGAFATESTAPRPTPTAGPPIPITPTSSVSGWFTYRDGTDGYAIQYPPALRLIPEDTAADGVTVYPAATPPNYAASRGLNLTPLITRPADTTLWEFAHNSTPTPPGLDNDTVISINGISTYSFDLIFGRSVIHHVFFFKDSDHGIDATYDAESPLAPSYRSVLGTFTFATATPVNLQ